MKKLVPSNAQLIPHSASRVFEGELFDIYQWPQKMFDGSVQTFEMARRRDAVIVLAVVDRDIILLEQSQPHWPKPRLTAPGGRCDDGESELGAAQREMREETGMVLADWRLISVLQPMEKIEWFIYIYLAQDLVETGKTQHDRGERIAVKRMPYDAAAKAAQNGERRLMSLRQFPTLDDLLAAPDAVVREAEVVEP